MLASCTKSTSDLDSTQNRIGAASNFEETKNSKVSFLGDFTPRSLGADILRRLTPIGFDQGLRLQKAKGLSLDTDPSHWPPTICGDGISCQTSLEEGFYSLVAGSDFIINNIPQAKTCPGMSHRKPLHEQGFMPIFGNPGLHQFQSAHCPYFYDWLNEGNQPYISLTSDTRDWEHDLTPNIYIGLQLNHQGSGGGFDVNNRQKAPMINDIDYIAFNYKASVCDPLIGQWYYGRAVVIYELWNPTFPDPNTGNPGYGIQLSINIAEYIRGVPRSQVSGALVDGVKPQNAMADFNDHWSNTWHMAGKDFPPFVEVSTPYLSASPHCPDQADGPWLGGLIHLKSILNHLALTVPHFPNNKAFYDGAYFSGGTLGGTEMFGRGRINFQLANHVFWNDPAAPDILAMPSIQYLPEGYYRHTPTGNKFYFNGNNAYCYFLGNPPQGQSIQETSISTDYIISQTNAGRCTWDL